MANRERKSRNSDSISSWAPKSLRMVISAKKLKMLAPWKESYEKPKQCIKQQRHHFANKGQYSQSYAFSSSYVWLWELDCKKGWALKNWCFWIVLEKTLESPLDCKEMKLVNPKGNQPWIFIGSIDAETEAPILWPTDAKTDSLEKNLMLGKIEDRRKRGQQRMRWLDRIVDSVDMNVSKLWDTARQRNLECCGPWGHEESDTT